MLFIVPIHLAALALFMYLYARHEADMSPYKIAMVFAIPIWILQVFSGYIGLLTLPAYFFIILLCLALWFYVPWGKSAAIAATFIVYVAAISTALNYLLTPPADRDPTALAPEFITRDGEHEPFDGVSILVSENFNKLYCQIVVDKFTVYDAYDDDPTIPSKPGWFIFCDPADSYWIYAGGEDSTKADLVHIKLEGSGRTIETSADNPDLMASSPPALRGYLRRKAERKAEKEAEEEKKNKRRGRYPRADPPPSNPEKKPTGEAATPPG